MHSLGLISRERIVEHVCVGEALPRAVEVSGTAAAWYLTALSRDVVITDRNDSLVRYSDTSPAAAAISGAVALVAQARPNLTGAQTVTLLLANATDAGTPGPDTIFGNGILNIGATFAKVPSSGHRF